MQKFYSDYNQVKVRHIKAFLDEAGIPCFIKNEYIQGGAGEIPANEALPEIWLIDNEWAPKAQAIVEQLEADLANNTAEWLCQQCNEINEGQFMICWQCQQTKTQEV